MEAVLSRRELGLPPRHRGVGVLKAHGQQYPRGPSIALDEIRSFERPLVYSWVTSPFPYVNLRPASRAHVGEHHIFSVGGQLISLCHAFSLWLAGQWWIEPVEGSESR